MRIDMSFSPQLEMALKLAKKYCHSWENCFTFESSKHDNPLHSSKRKDLPCT